MEFISYDFSILLDTFQSVIDKKNITASDLYLVKSELNKFFKDSECTDVLFTNNNDKMFFGIKVLPIIDSDDIYDYLLSNEPKRIDKYIVEIDSHIMNPVIDATSIEIVSLILREVWHIVHDSSPIDNARNALNSYLSANKEYLRISQSIHCKELLAYGLKDYLSKTQSIFYNNDESDIIGDEFASFYGFNESLHNIYLRLINGNMKIYENEEISKFITFGWTISMYKNLKTRRVGAIHTLNRAKELTGSRLEKMEIDNVIKRIKRIDDEMLAESVGNSIRLKIKEKMKKARLNNLKTIDSTFYELNMQIRNVEDENDALYLMRQINNNIAIISEYCNSTNCDSYEIEQWNKVLDKFVKLRDKLSSTVVYKNKNYGVFVNYPDIVENRY